MKYDIYHHNDLDGRASAAVMLDFFRLRGDEIGRFIAIDYDIEPRWETLKFLNPAVIVDFLYHPRAAWWIDHHETTFMKNAWREKFKADAQHCWDPAYPSGCGLAVKILKENFGYRPPRHIVQLARALDVFDAARFRSARQAVEAKEPGILLGWLLNYLESEKVLQTWLIEKLSVKSLGTVIREPKIRPLVKRYRMEQKRLLAFAKKHMVMDGKASLLDITSLKKTGGEVRFIPFYLNPNVHYALRMRRIKDGSYRVAIGKNPWKLKSGEDVHIGKFLRKHYGGGGHPGAGGADIKGKIEPEMLGREIINKLRKESKKNI
jgi:hypothetical protein